MQTFLTSKNFDQTAKSLDSRRLNKQILEGYQILRVLSNITDSNAWRNHPAVKMWRTHESFLMTYVAAMIREADKRGIKTDTHKSNLKLLNRVAGSGWGSSVPEWFTNSTKMNKIIATHKANLFIKDPEFYHEYYMSQFDPHNEPCCETCKYYWVTHEESRKVSK